MRYYVILFLVCSSLLSHGQLKFKLLVNGGRGASATKENFVLSNSGLLLEKKIDIDKSIEFGIVAHSFSFFVPIDKQKLRESLASQPLSADVFNLRNKLDSISHFHFKFYFVSFPIAFNYYMGPKSYLTYKLNLNNFSSSNFGGSQVTNGEFSSSVPVFSRDLEEKMFRSWYVSHNISINCIVLRRIDLGLDFIFTNNRTFFKTDPGPVLNAVDKQISKYFAVGITTKIFMFQINSKRI